MALQPDFFPLVANCDAFRWNTSHQLRDNNDILIKAVYFQHTNLGGSGHLQIHTFYISLEVCKLMQIILIYNYSKKRYYSHKPTYIQKKIKLVEEKYKCATKLTTDICHFLSLVHGEKLHIFIYLYYTILSKPTKA